MDSISPIQSIAVVVYDGFDELDAIGPYEVFTNAADRGAGFDIVLCTLEPTERITASHGLVVEPDGTLDGFDADLVVVPGGGWNDRADHGARAEAQGPLPDELARRHREGATVAGVCTGGMLLAAAGLLDGRPATTHRGALADLRDTDAEVVDSRVVDDGDVLTAGAITSGLDLALWLVEREFGDALAGAVAREMEYDPRGEVYRARHRRKQPNRTPQTRLGRTPHMGTRLDSREAQAAEVIDRLDTEYPDATISLDFANRFELLVAVILSAQCTDERVNQTTADLFETYPSPEAFANAPKAELAEALNSITYYNNKAGYIHDTAERIVEDHDGRVPDTMAELTDLPGVGRKTANVVLQHAYDVVEGVVVDTHVQRLTRRLGLTDEERPEKIETDLMELVPEEHWRAFTHLFIGHGRATCTARNPDCADCALEDLCPSSKLDNDVDRASGEAW